MKKHDRAQWLAARRVVLRRELRFLGLASDLTSTDETGLLYLLELMGRKVLPGVLDYAAVDRMDDIPVNHPISEEIL